MVIEGLGVEWCSQIGISGSEYPVGDFHPQGISTFVTARLFQNP